MQSRLSPWMSRFVHPSACVTPSGAVVVFYRGDNVLMRVRSKDGGRTWARPRRLTPRGMRLPWIAQTGIGRMLADYVSASWTGGRTVAVVSLADEPVNGAFRQATFAAAFGV